MKKKYLLFLPLLFLGLCTLSQSKRALIVAIGNYDAAKTGWSVINVDNDVVLIQESLLKQNFLPSNISILRHEAATRDAIIKALDNLIKQSEAGDVVVIHFSSHGQQLEDEGEDEMDKLDESIVPYGAVYTNNPVEFEKHKGGYFRDDEFG